MELQRVRLGITQGQLCPGGACSAIAMMEGDLFVSRGSRLPGVEEIRKRMSHGASLYMVLTSNERRRLGIKVVVGEYLMPQQVMEAVVDEKTTKRRWKVLMDIVGVHDEGMRPAVVQEYLSGLDGRGGDTIYRDDKDQMRDTTPLRLVQTMGEAFQCLDTLALETGHTVAGALTYGVHTVMLAATQQSASRCVYSALDSLTGEWIYVNTKLSAVADCVAKQWCPPHNWNTHPLDATANLATFNSPGTFYLLLYTIDGA